MFTRFRLQLTFICSLYAPLCTAQKYTFAVQQQIQKVESSLSSWAIVAGDTSWTLQERMKHYHVNGVSIAVISNYKIAWTKGYGWADSATKRPVTVNTLFQAASISKSLNAIGILKLVEDGQLDLYRDINAYLKTWKFPYDSLSGNKKITIANLLSHTAGLGVHGFPGYEIDDTIPDLLRILNGEKPANSPAIRSVWPPSTRFAYSGGGIEISQLIVENITHVPYEKYMNDNVLLPMGMTNSTYSRTPTKNAPDKRATAYYDDGREVTGKYHIYPESAAAGLWTTPTDLAKYVMETQVSLAGRSHKVLSQRMTSLQLTPYIDSESALGVFIVKRGTRLYFTHNGLNEGFVSLYYGSLEGGDGVVVMANTDKMTILNEIANSVAKVYEWKEFYVPKLKKIKQVSNSIIDAYAGKYRLAGREITIAKEGDGLVLKYEDNRFNMLFTSDTDFFCYELIDRTFTFFRDNQSNVIGFVENGDKTKTARKI